MKSVVIRKQAFVPMVVSCIEVYKKEALGLLLGRASGDEYVVTDAVPYQSAKRDYEYVSISPKKENRVNNVLKFISSSRLVGDFHSHPDWHARLSRHDKKELFEAGNHFVSITIVVKASKQLKPWRRNSDESVSGTISKNFFVKMTAFAINGNGKIAPVRIKCDYLRSINRKMSDYRRLQLRLSEIEREKREQEKVRRLTEKRLKEYFGVKAVG